METTQQNFDVLSAFGLTEKQTVFLFSLEYFLTQQDIVGTKSDEKGELKKQWLTNWADYLQRTTVVKEQGLIESFTELVCAFKTELSTTETKTWLHLIILEAVTFEPYFPVDEEDDSNKEYSKLKYEEQIEKLKFFCTEVGECSAETVERYKDSYEKMLDVGTDKIKNRIIQGLMVVAAAGLAAAMAGVFAGPIAVGLAGGAFAGLHGAALTSAALAYFGGGAIAVGGLGMAGGVATIVGGGALIGTAGGGAVAGVFHLLVKSNPKIALSNGAKLNVVIREIILSAQKDTQYAQMVMKSYKEDILALNRELAMMRMELVLNDEEIGNLKKSLEYLERLYRDAAKFSNDFQVDLGVGDSDE